MPVSKRATRRAPPRRARRKLNTGIPPSPVGGLTWRPALYKARTCRFLAVRKWKVGSKEADLEAFKARKYACDPELVEAVANEMVAVLVGLIYNTTGWLVTNPPRGGSLGKTHAGHFATELARVIAGKIGIEHRLIFKPGRKRSWRAYGASSHTSRRVLSVIQEPEKANYILIDDLATSGSTIEECAHYLAKYGSVMPIVWIYGNVK